MKKGGIRFLLTKLNFSNAFFEKWIFKQINKWVECLLNQGCESREGSSIRTGWERIFTKRTGSQRDNALKNIKNSQTTVPFQNIPRVKTHRVHPFSLPSPTVRTPPVLYAIPPSSDAQSVDGLHSSLSSCSIQLGDGYTSASTISQERVSDRDGQYINVFCVMKVRPRVIIIKTYKSLDMLYTKDI